MKVLLFGGPKNSSSNLVVFPYTDAGPLAEHLAKYPYLAVRGTWIHLPSGDMYKVLRVSGLRYMVSTTYVARGNVPDLQVLACKKILWRPFYKVQLAGRSGVHWVPESIVSDYLQGELLPDLLS